MLHLSLATPVFDLLCSVFVGYSKLLKPQIIIIFSPAVVSVVIGVTVRPGCLF
jgi:hypothetical protein